VEAAGIEPTPETPENSGVLTEDAAKSAAVPETDPLRALLGSMTVDQKKRLGELLLNDPS